MLVQQLQAIQGGASMRIAMAPSTNRKPPPPKQSIGVGTLQVLPMPRSSSSSRRMAVRCRMAEPSGKPAPMGQKTCYKDSWAENFLLGLCVRRLGKFTGNSFQLNLLPIKLSPAHVRNHATLTNYAQESAMKFEFQQVCRNPSSSTSTPPLINCVC